MILRGCCSNALDIRSCTAGHFRESRTCCEFLVCFCYWFRFSLHSLLATSFGTIFNLTLYRNHWRRDEHVHLQIYAVSLLFYSSPFIPKYSSRLSLKHVANGGSLAEEVISTVRTAQAFGTQKILADLYDTHINESRKVDLKAAVWHGGGLAVFFFVIYSAYALCEFLFYFKV